MTPKKNRPFRPGNILATVKFVIVGMLTLLLIAVPSGENSNSNLFLPTARAGSSYADLSSSNFGFSLNAGNVNLINTNDDWSGIPSMEGYAGTGLTATHGVDPQTIVGTEFAGNALISSSTQVNANKGNPSAYNAGGVTEFESGAYISLGFQGNTQANPYIVLYANSTGRANITVSYDLTDIDGGSNNAVSPVALQYRTSTTGVFTNVPAGFVADVSDGPTVHGRVTSRSVLLPPNASNQPILQVRLITTNAANAVGGSTSDEWIGVSNVSISSLAPSAANVELSGRVTAGKSGVSGAVVTLHDEFGRTRTVATNPFGYYRFEDLRAASTVIVSVTSKRYVFDTQVVTLFDSLSDVDFHAIE